MVNWFGDISSEKLLKISLMKDEGFNNKQKALRELYGIHH